MKTINREAEARLSHEYLVSILDYNPETGIFLWKMSTAQCIKIGDMAGCVTRSGYTHITINFQVYKAHRLAWFYVHKEWPKGIIDHIDQNPRNNSILNLRDTCVSTNCHNSKIRKDNNSGIKGVHFCNSSKRWKARIMVNSKRIALGTFLDFEMAVKARKEAEIKYAISC